MTLVSKAFSDIITFSRSSNATRVGPTGRVEYAPHNLLTYSEQFDNAAFYKARSTVTANAATSPDGTVTADSIIEDTTANESHCIFQSASLGAGTYTASCYFKKSTRSFACLRISTDGDTKRYAVTINLDTGEFGSSDSNGSPTNTAYTITNFGNGWYRLSVTAAHSAGLVYATIAVSNAAIPTYGSALPLYTGNGTSGIYLWGAQLSVGPYPLDYTPTTSAAVYGPRFDYDPVTLAARGLLVEEQRTNLLTYSEQFDNAAWSKSGATVSANFAAAPDGQVTADKIVENSATSNHEVFQSVSITSGTAYTLSFFAKASGRDYVACGHNGTGSYAYSYFNLANGSVVSSGSGHTASIQSFGNGWYRVISTFTAGVTASVAFEILASDNGSRISYAGDGTSGILVWGAQLE